MLDLPICCEHGSFQDNQSASVYIQIFPESQVVIFGPLHYITLQNSYLSHCGKRTQDLYKVLTDMTYVTFQVFV